MPEQVRAPIEGSQDREVSPAPFRVLGTVGSVEEVFEGGTPSPVLQHVVWRTDSLWMGTDYRQVP